MSILSSASSPLMRSLTRSLCDEQRQQAVHQYFPVSLFRRHPITGGTYKALRADINHVRHWQFREGSKVLRLRAASRMHSHAQKVLPPLRIRSRLLELELDVCALETQRDNEALCVLSAGNVTNAVRRRFQPRGLCDAREHAGVQVERTNTHISVFTKKPSASSVCPDRVFCPFLRRLRISSRVRWRLSL